MKQTKEDLEMACQLFREEMLRDKATKKQDEKNKQVADALDKKELTGENLKVNPVVAQEKILNALTQETQKSWKEELEWCTNKLNLRISDATITHATIEGRPSQNKGVKIYVKMYRHNRKHREQPQFLKFYGYSEWLEIRDAIQKSKSKFKDVVERFVDQLLQRMSQHVQVPPLPEQTNRRKSKSNIEEGPSFKNEHETKFDYESLLGHLEIPDIPC